MELEFKPDWPAARRRIEAFWNGERGVGPLLSVTAPNGCPRRLPDPPSLEGRWLDYEYRLELSEDRMRSTYFGGEAVPTFWPDFGPDLTAAFLGGDLELKSAGWALPVIDDWDRDLPRISFDPERNIWWQRTMELAELMVERSRGRCLVTIPDVDGGTDTAAALRGAGELCSDLYDYPDHVHALLKTISPANAEIVNRLYPVLSRYHTGNVNTIGCWTPGRSYCVRSDFSLNISPAQYREFVRPHVEWECRHAVDYTLYHLDGASHLLDEVLSIPQVPAMQYSPHPARDSGSHLDLVPMYKRVLGAGKAIVQGVPAAEVKPLLNELGSERVWLMTCVESKEDADALLGSIGRREV